MHAAPQIIVSASVDAALAQTFMTATGAVTSSSTICRSCPPRAPSLIAIDLRSPARVKDIEKVFPTPAHAIVGQDFGR
jgi:hypothetical protein